MDQEKYDIWLFNLITQFWGFGILDQRNCGITKRRWRSVVEHWFPDIPVNITLGYSWHQQSIRETITFTAFTSLCILEWLKSYKIPIEMNKKTNQLCDTSDIGLYFTLVTKGNDHFIFMLIQLKWTKNQPTCDTSDIGLYFTLVTKGNDHFILYAHSTGVNWALHPFALFLDWGWNTF